MSLSDYHLFLSLKNFLSGQNFKSGDEIQNAVGCYFASKMGSMFFEHGIQKPPHVGVPWLISVENISLIDVIYDCYFWINMLTKKATLIIARPNIRRFRVYKW